MHRLTLLLVSATLSLPALSHAAPAQPAPAQATPKPQIQKVPEVTLIFPDVPKDHWAAAAVHNLAKAGIIEGDPKGHFRGNNPITRYEFAVVIARILDRQVSFLSPPLYQPNLASAPEASPQQTPANQPK